MILLIDDFYQKAIPRWLLLTKKGFVILLSKMPIRSYMMALMGSAILAFGLYHVHAFSGITEGGVLGMTLLLQHWFHVSPAISGFLMNFACYFLGWRVLGKTFVLYSMIAGGGFSIFYMIFEQFQPLWPNLSQYPLIAAILGAIFVGVGVGISVRAGGAPGGDDALAMSLSKLTGKNIQWIYLISDLIVLFLSLSYIPMNKILFSLLTVILSGQIISWVQQISTE